MSKSQASWNDGKPGGLYDPSLEKDACGVGLVANVSGIPSHEIVRDGITILERMEHRGACGCDVATGDGSGLLLAIPDKFFRRSLRQNYGVELPRKGQYGCGLVFLPRDFEARQQAKRIVEEVIEAHGLTFIAWRKVPVNNQLLGPGARSSEPFIEQVFIEASDEMKANPDSLPEVFERILWVLRREATASPTSQFYICSLSSKTIIYKGLLTPEQVNLYFIDLGQKDFESHVCLAHSRFATNTTPNWDRSQPLRLIAHNGEINTLRGNANWMRAREGTMKSSKIGENLKKVFPVIEPAMSDSGCLDNVLELLVHAGRDITEAILMCIPEPWQKHKSMSNEKKNFYEYHSNLVEPWDGPAFVGFCNGNVAGAVLDRNGLRPGRYWVTKKGKVILASEVGVCDVADDRDIIQKGRLTPGEMFLIDFEQQQIIADKEIKHKLASAKPYGAILKNRRINLNNVFENVEAKLDLLEKESHYPALDLPILTKMKTFGFTVETVEMILGPMVKSGYESLGSMGNDAALACLSENPKRIFDYFQQLFAQVTNPPIDPIRESVVMSMMCPIGPEDNILEPGQDCCHRVSLNEPVLGPMGFHSLIHLDAPGWKPEFFQMTWPKAEGVEGLERAITRISQEAEQAVRNGCKLLVLSDRFADADNVPIPSLLAAGAVHQHLVKAMLRTQTGLVVECGDAHEVHHMSLLVGFGVDAIYPWLVFTTMGKVNGYDMPEDYVAEEVAAGYVEACVMGMYKVIAKMGISTIQSYKGAQIFEALGVADSVIEKCFTGCASRIGGCGFEIFARDVLRYHDHAFPPSEDTDIANDSLASPGEYHWRTGPKAEAHLNHPDAIAKLQEAARYNSRSSYNQFAKLTNSLNKLCTLRGQLELTHGDWDAIPIEHVEPAKEIVKRFATGAMSYGSISIEAHSTLAVAMNKLGGKSNTGEGGEHISRYGDPSDPNTSRSAIKQVASGRFGVHIYYLSNAEEIQIKMAQGAKPGEGGELPGHKVVGEIAKTRNSTPGVGLISPPPHHDIYSIEDLSQLIFDLKNANPSARISVKLVSEVGVGVIASGVAKGKADHILISGHDGGTGAAKWTGIKHAGLPWELGLAETHQTLVKNGLRGRVTVQTDGQLKTGLDIVKAAMLGAEEFCLATAPLITLGCIMMRKCHLNTCPVGIATQDPELRKMFSGQPEHVMNYLFMMAEEARGYMASLGISSFDKLVGRSDLLIPIKQNRVKTKGLDLSRLLVPATMLNPSSPMTCVEKQDHELDGVLDRRILARIRKNLPKLDKGEKIRSDFKVCNTDRAVGTTLSHVVTKRYGLAGLEDGSIHLRFKGSVGQSFGAWCAPGVLLELNGDANDYVGKGLSGGKLVVYPPKGSGFKAEDNVIVGNVCLYGAVRGKCFFSGRACQRFAVRNSGAEVVVEGVGDHGCEYMTGGTVVILGPTGRNFGAGMSGGIAYIYDPQHVFKERCNMGLVLLEEVSEKADLKHLESLIDEHRRLTGSPVADRILWNWEQTQTDFVKVIPSDYKKVMMKQSEKKEEKDASFSDTTKAVKDKSIPKIKQDTTSSESKRESKSATDIEDLAGPPRDRPYRVENPVKRRGFIEYERKALDYRDPKERASDFDEIYTEPEHKQLKTQAARCMDCGVPFCHQEDNGCPLGNKIPEWNNLVFSGKWKEALTRLLETNNFPEFTGRVCPAPCEGACVLGITEKPVTIKNIECTIIDKGFEMGWMHPNPPKHRSGKRVAIIGSGPAGLAAADQLNKVGHFVTVYERDDRIGGLLMYGIPNMKLDKKLVVSRRIDKMTKEGIVFVSSCNVGVDIKMAKLESDNDAVILATGATRPRDLPVEGRELKGVDFAMKFLGENTKSYLDSSLRDGRYISAKGKKVIVIGGGDTGNDCIGTAIRHGATSVVNFELLPKPPVERASGNPWPQWPRVFRVDYGHKEVESLRGRDPRDFCVLTKRFLPNDAGDGLGGVETVQIQWAKDPEGRWIMKEIEGSQQVYKADLAFLAMGYTGPETESTGGVELEFDRHGNYKASYGTFKTSRAGVFACGDCRRGQSLVVWGIAEGRQCAREVDRYMMGTTTLP